MYGERIKELRIERGWSQAELAEKLNVTQKAISHYEQEVRDLRAANIIALSHIFEVSCDYILGIEDETGAKKYR